MLGLAELSRAQCPVLLLPGRGYTVNHPALYYVAEVARDLGWRTEAVSWQDTDLPDHQVIAHGRTALASLPPGSIVIGKSLGSLLLPDVVARGLPGVWLTPLAHRPEIRADILAHSGPSVLVGAAADELWDSTLAHQSGHAVRELDGGDHRLQLAHNAVGSARFLVSLVEHTPTFLAGRN